MLPLILLCLALFIWLLAGRAQRASGLPSGQVVYSDTRGWGQPEKPLFSARLQLTGKPDYLVRNGNAYIPVEVKSGKAPPHGPYDAHIYQLAAYCVLVAEVYRTRPAYGLIKYSDQTLRVDFTRELEKNFLRLLEQMRLERSALDVARSHHMAARCRGCGFREVCGQRLN